MADDVILLTLQLLGRRHHPAVDLGGDDAVTRQLGVRPVNTVLDR
jgi:hypothetical protein